jgi:hypothetical protein
VGNGHVLRCVALSSSRDDRASVRGEAGAANACVDELPFAIVMPENQRPPLSGPPGRHPPTTNSSRWRIGTLSQSEVRKPGR